MLKTKPNNRMKYIRQLRGLSQSELACATGISVRVIQNFEQGQNNLNGAKLHTICKIASALHCSLLDIILEDEVIKNHFKTFENSIDNLHSKGYNIVNEDLCCFSQGSLK